MRLSSAIKFIKYASHELLLHRSKFPISDLFALPEGTIFIGSSKCSCPEFRLIILSIVFLITPSNFLCVVIVFLCPGDFRLFRWPPTLVNLMEFRDIEDELLRNFLRFFSFCCVYSALSGSLEEHKLFARTFR